MLSLISLLTLLLSASSQTFSTCNNAITIDQAILWRGSVVPKTSGVYTYPYSYPQPISTSATRGLSLNSFCFDVNLIISFRVDLAVTTPTVDTIRIKIYSDLSIYYICYNLILIDSTSSWIWQ
jgi:hypothetical protein